MLAPGVAEASRSSQAQLAAYVRARAADSLGESRTAVAGYGEALASAPQNQVIAGRALRQALAAGDRPLAVKAARVLDSMGVNSPDVRCVLLVEALRTEDWALADRQVEALAGDEVFSFMAPMLRAWTAVGSGRGDPLKLLDTGATDPFGSSYVAEHRPLLLLAVGQEREGLIALRNRVEAQDSRAQRLQVAGAAYLARLGRRDEAAALLSGDGALLAANRRWLLARKALPGEVRGPQQGVAELFLRLAIDLRRQDVAPLAISFARLATFLDPRHSETWLVTSALLAGEQEQAQALDALASIPGSDPAAELADDARIELLASADRKEEALKRARKAARRKDADSADWQRLGNVYAQLNRQNEAAEAYANALAARTSDDRRLPWTLWLLRGSALEQADRWPEAKAALEQAYRLAPKEPTVLNYLGYAQLERRENLSEAERLITEARTLQPESPQITDSLGWAYYLQGKTEQAIDLLERAVQGEPTDAAINEHLGDAYYSIGRRFEARYAWQAALVSAEEKDLPRLKAKIDAGLTPELASP